MPCPRPRTRPARARRRAHRPRPRGRLGGPARAGRRAVPPHDPEEGQAPGGHISPLSIDARTDAEGVATFDWLPADLQGGRRSVRSRTVAFPSAVALAGSRRARDGADGPRPSHGAGLGQGDPARRLARPRHPGRGPKAVGGRDRSAQGRVRTAADGSYAMDLPPEQSYMIGVIDDEWAAPSRGGVVVREGVPGGLDLTLERGAVIRGRVTAGPESKPVAGHTGDPRRARTGGPARDVQGSAASLFNELPSRRRYRRGRPLRLPGRAGHLPARGPHTPGVECSRSQHDLEVGRRGKSSETSRCPATPAVEDPSAVSCGRGTPTARRSPTRSWSSSRSAAASAGPGLRRRSGPLRVARPDGKADLLRPQPGGRPRRLRGDSTRTTTGRSRSSPGRRRPPAAGSSMRTASPGRRSMSSIRWRSASRPSAGGPPGAVQSVLTDADGRFTAPGLPIGTLAISVRMPPAAATGRSAASM